MDKNELQRRWEDERNWGHGSWGAYFCKDDPRLVVPKRRLVGGTFNMAHRWAVPLLTAILVFLILFILVGALGTAAGLLR